MIRKKDEDKKGIVESFLGGIPRFGKFFRELGRTEAFQKRFKEVNEQIEGNLRKGEKKYANVEGNISVRPLSISPSMRPIIGELKRETSELAIQKDYVYGKKGDKLVLGIKTHKNVDLSIKGKTLFLKKDNFQKKIRLPDFYKNITKKHYKKGILVLELTK